MNHEIFHNRIALRIDVDYPSLVPEAVPFMIDVLGSADMKATFFVAFGIEESGFSVRRLARSGYLKRLRRLQAWRLLKRFVFRLTNPGPVLADLVKQIIDGGHELAVHGYHHSWWIDNIRGADEAQIRNQIEKAYKAAGEMAETKVVHAWGSPGWITTDTVLHLLAECGVPYLAECWGHEPFVTLTGEKKRINVPHLPITLASFETLVADRGFEAEVAVKEVMRDRPADKYDMMVCHDYYEGALRKDLFRSFIEVTAKQGIKTVSLKTVAAGILGKNIELPKCRLQQKQLGGFTGWVSWQGEASQ